MILFLVFYLLPIILNTLGCYLVIVKFHYQNNVAPMICTLACVFTSAYSVEFMDISMIGGIVLLFLGAALTILPVDIFWKHYLKKTYGRID